MRGHRIGTAVRGATLSCPRAGGRIEAGRPQSRREMRAPRLSARPSVCHATVLTLAARAGPPQPAWRGPAASPWRRGCVSMATWLRAPPPAVAAAHEGPRRGRVQLVPGFPSCSDDDKESRAAGCEVGEGGRQPGAGPAWRSRAWAAPGARGARGAPGSPCLARGARRGLPATVLPRGHGSLLQARGGPGAGTQGSGGLSELRRPFASPDAPQSGRCPRGDGRRPALSKGTC